METAMIDAAVAAPIGHREAMQLAEAEFAEMVAQLRSLSADDWNRPTVCELWDVRTMACHVLATAESQASFRQFAHDFRAAGKRTVGKMIDAMTATQVSERSSLTPDAIVGPPVINSGVREVEIEAQLPVGRPACEGSGNDLPVLHRRERHSSRVLGPLEAISSNQVIAPLLAAPVLRPRLARSLMTASEASGSSGVMKGFTRFPMSKKNPIFLFGRCGS
jgi:hypothetical protein